MLRSGLIYSCLLVLFGSLFIYTTLIRIQESDEQDYRFLVSNNLAVKCKNPLATNNFSQERQGVEKYLWPICRTAGPTASVRADRSTLHLFSHDKTIWMTEQLDCPIFGYALSSDKPYSISSDKACLKIPQNLPLKGLENYECQFQGNVRLLGPNQTDLFGDELVFKNHIWNLRSHTNCLLRQGEDWMTFQNLVFDANTKIGYGDHPEGCSSRLSLVFKSESAQVRLDEQFEPVEICLKEQVSLKGKFHGKESVALADVLFYCVADKKTILSSNFPNQVLFWQPELTLSVPELHLQKDWRAIGNVRLILNLEEQQKIEAFLNHL